MKHIILLFYKKIEKIFIKYIFINIMPQLKNQTFINNITDPITGKQIKKIFQIKISKLDKIVEPMVWEYFKNRNNTSISQIYKKYHGYQLKIIFFNDPVIHIFNTINSSDYKDNIPNNSTLKIIN